MEPESLERPKRRLTAAKFEQIRPGMTYEEVLAVLEIPEDRRPPDMELIGPESDVELKWVGGTNDDDQSITVYMKGKDGRPQRANWVQFEVVRVRSSSPAKVACRLASI